MGPMPDTPGGQSADLDSIAQQLIDAYDRASTIPRITLGSPGFDTTAAYAVLDRISARRRQRGWTPVGRKIGFTNRTIWARYGVDGPMWAPLWAESVSMTAAGRASVSLRPLVQPRIEPEVVFKLRAPVPVTDDPVDVLQSVEWMAAGFEIVQCHFPDWEFALPDCTAAFGLHAALVVGTPVAVDDENRPAIAARLAEFEVTLLRDGGEVDRGSGANVLGSPALALSHLAFVLEGRPGAPALAAGEIVTTGTVTDAWPVTAGEAWTSVYGELGVKGLTVSFT